MFKVQATVFSQGINQDSKIFYSTGSWNSNMAGLNEKARVFADCKLLQPRLMVLFKAAAYTSGDKVVE
jgi:hypothetical protein